MERPFSDPLSLSDETKPFREDPQGSGRAQVWPRFWARQIDLYCTALLIGLAWLALPPNMRWNSPLILLLVPSVHVVVETALLVIFGTTPGKRFLGMRVCERDGQPLSIARAFRRSLTVWYQGTACSIPMLNVVTGLLALERLQDEGRAPWDKSQRLRVMYEPVGGFAIRVAVLMVVLQAVHGVWLYFTMMRLVRP